MQKTQHRVGRPRTSLVELHGRWTAGDRRAVGKVKDKALQAFYREFVASKPQGIQQLLDLQDLLKRYEREILASLQPPFCGFLSLEADDATQEQFMASHGVFRDFCIRSGLIIPVREGEKVEYIGRQWLTRLWATRVVFRLAWPVYWASQPTGTPPHNHSNPRPADAAGQAFFKHLQRAAANEASVYRARNVLAAPPGVSQAISRSPRRPTIGPDGQAVNHKGHYLGMTAPPARPDPIEPYMRDGSHLLASERGRRRIDPVTGKRMIKQMRLTDEAWPHYEWVEDPAVEFAVGPYGPHVSFWMPDDPRTPSPRAFIRPILEKMGRLDSLQYFMPGPDDEDQSNPPSRYYNPPLDAP